MRRTTLYRTIHQRYEVPTKSCFILFKFTDQSMGKPNGLLRHHHSHFWKLRSERILWLLLRANAAKIILGYGTFEYDLSPGRTTSERNIDRCDWHRLRYCIRESQIPVPSLAASSSRHVCRLWSLGRLPRLPWSVYVWI